MASTSKGIFPKPCTASVWKKTPLSRQMAPISAIRWIVPISLFASISVTRTVLSVRAARTRSGGTSPVFSGAR